MTSSTFSEDELLSHLACRPKHVLDRVIPSDESAKPSFSKIERKAQSSLGSLGNLPLELLHITFSHLDLRSLSRLSRVSLLGKIVVESIPAYKCLLMSAGHIFRILSRTRVITLHSTAALYVTLRSDRCVSCGKYGAFLLLLSCERCCRACLSHNQSLWMITRSFARDCFQLTKEEVKTLPTMRSIPGSYGCDSGSLVNDPSDSRV